jgi:hypothetical protein
MSCYAVDPRVSGVKQLSNRSFTGRTQSYQPTSNRYLSNHFCSYLIHIDPIDPIQHRSSYYQPEYPVHRPSQPCSYSVRPILIGTFSNESSRYFTKIYIILYSAISSHITTDSYESLCIYFPRDQSAFHLSNPTSTTGCHILFRHDSHHHESILSASLLLFIYSPNPNSPLINCLNPNFFSEISVDSPGNQIAWIC